MWIFLLGLAIGVIVGIPSGLIALYFFIKKYEDVINEDIEKDDVN